MSGGERREPRRRRPDPPRRRRPQDSDLPLREPSRRRAPWNRVARPPRRRGTAWLAPRRPARRGTAGAASGVDRAPGRADTAWLARLRRRRCRPLTADTATGRAPRASRGASARRAAAITASTHPPCRPRRPCSSNQAMPGLSDSTAAPMPSSAPTTRSHASATPAGSGVTRRRVGTAGERLPQPQPGTDAVGLGGGRGLADQGLATDLGRERQRTRGERLSATGGDRELEAWKKDADDHRQNRCSHGGRRNGCSLSQSRRSFVWTRVTALVEPEPTIRRDAACGCGGDCRRRRSRSCSTNWRAAALVVSPRGQDARRGGGPVVGDVGAGRRLAPRIRGSTRGEHAALRLHDRPQPARRLAAARGDRAAGALAARHRAAADRGRGARYRRPAGAQASRAAAGGPARSRPAPGARGARLRRDRRADRVERTGGPPARVARVEVAARPDGRGGTGDDNPNDLASFGPRCSRATGGSCGGAVAGTRPGRLGTSC